jgi:MOSC domain-containing protein YiiM
MQTKISGVFVGKPKKFGDEGGLSGYRKTDPGKPVKVFFESLEGDQVHNLKFHGGVDRVVHQFPNEHYAFLMEHFPQIKKKLVPSSYGENISASKMTEENVCIGDIYRVGTALLQVTEPRSPCQAINVHFETPNVMQVLLKHKKIGWLYRVLEEGQFYVGDDITLQERPQALWSVDLLIDVILLQKQKVDESLIREWSQSELFSKRWRERIRAF